jgi:hypothetical protein
MPFYDENGWYSVVGMEEPLNSLDLAPAFNPIYGVSMTNIIRLEEISELRE